jgi:hypothetical protein
VKVGLLPTFFAADVGLDVGIRKNEAIIAGLVEDGRRSLTHRGAMTGSPRRSDLKKQTQRGERPVELLGGVEE